ncbi:dentin sialophosphoprotein-related [Abeliophyllum distichum]|uniref:Dentin sialophosphoprotein-related n=1 Tax=Abeliophyllum distichum TaxID=126358 RepID=A0ABD1RTK2_9LAMI
MPNSFKKSVNAAVKPPSMTPQEKIEKLRRRQQMRAIIAIKKQQQQFGNQVSIIENSTMEGGNIEVDENVTSFPSLEPNSPIEHDNSSTVNNAVFNDCSVEGSILHRLQETIDKLDIQIRLCIRDSLFRLAQSAKQRQHSSDTISFNPSSKDDALSKYEGNNPERFTRMPDVETDTNPIDRTVAHLLFHRPLEFSGKAAEAPESPISAKLPCERKDTLPTGYFLESSENMQITSPHGSKTLGIFTEGDQSKNSPVLRHF